MGNLQNIFGRPWYWWLAVFIVMGAMLWFGKEIGESVAEKV
jgi:hypothetical protein